MLSICGVPGIMYCRCDQCSEWVSERLFRETILILSARVRLASIREEIVRRWLRPMYVQTATRDVHQKELLLADFQIYHGDLHSEIRECDLLFPLRWAVGL